MVAGPPLMGIEDHTFNQAGRRGILEAHTVGEPARKVTALSEDERIAAALEELSEVYPELRFVRTRRRVYFRPCQLLSLGPHLAWAEGRIHFAGEHTSAWVASMEGESGIRAAPEVAAEET